MMLPAINSKLYHQIVAAMVNLPYNSSERLRLAVLQKELSQVQQRLAAEKKLDIWLKAG